MFAWNKMIAKKYYQKVTLVIQIQKNIIFIVHQVRDVKAVLKNVQIQNHQEVNAITDAQISSLSVRFLIAWRMKNVAQQEMKNVKQHQKLDMLIQRTHQGRVQLAVLIQIVHPIKVVQDYIKMELIQNGYQQHVLTPIYVGCKFNHLMKETMLMLKLYAIVH